MTGHYSYGWIPAVLISPFIGSFLGVLALRLPTGAPIALSRSACPHCGRKLSVLELLPLISWLVLKGRCRSCASPLGLFYPGIELAALAIALWAAVSLPASLVWVGCGLGWTLLGASVVDWQHHWLPDILVLPLIPAGLAVHAFIQPDAWVDHTAGAVAGFAGFVAVAHIYRAIRRRDGLGFGDAKLLAAAGAWVSWTGLPTVVLLAAVFGLTGAIAGRLAGREIGPATELPFGPALALATWLVWLYGPLVPMDY